MTPTEAHVADGSFTFSRFLYNVSCVGDPANGEQVRHRQRRPRRRTTKYVGKNGWLCKATAHAG